MITEETFDKLERDTFGYFLYETNAANGLVPDNTRLDAVCSITAVGLALASYTIAAERGWMTRREAAERTLVTLHFFWNSPQGEESDATGYKGFYYHFLDMQTGRRRYDCEVSTIDSTFLLAGILTAATYFDDETKEEREIRRLADALYARADWQWAQNGELTVTHGWTPERGFIPHRWEGYDEALILYALGLGSLTHPLPKESYVAWTNTFQWRELYGHKFLYAGPLFIHQLPFVWIDPRGIQDDYMRAKGIDYFENSRRATYVQREHAIHNPEGFSGFHENCWGVTASDGPGPATKHVNGVKRYFYDYIARGIPDGPHDGTIAPWAVVSSLPFAPEIVLPAIEYFNDAYPEMTSHYGFKCSFNPTYSDKETTPKGWISRGYYGLDQGPIVMMIENYRSGFFWELMRRCSPLMQGLRRAGFTGGWLDSVGESTTMGDL